MLSLVGADLISGYLTLIPHFLLFPLSFHFSFLSFFFFNYCYLPGLLLYYIYHALSIPEIAPTFIVSARPLLSPLSLSLLSFFKHLEWTSRVFFPVQYMYTTLYTFTLYLVLTHSAAI